MDRLDALRMFVKLADSGSFSRTAQSSGVTQSAVSKQLLHLEARLGTPLLRRSTRGQSLTEAGQEYYAAARRLLNDFDLAELRVSDIHREPRGSLRLSTSAAFGRLYVLPSLAGFFARFPEVSLDFDVSERHANLIGEGIDLAIRTGPLADSPFVATRVGSVRYVTVATLAYLEEHGTPVQPADIVDMPGIVFQLDGAVRPWQFKVNGEAHGLEPRVVIRSNDSEHIRGAALEGLGLAHGPSWLYAADVAAGRLVKVLNAFAPDPLELNIISPTGRQMPRKSQVFMAYVSEKFSEDPELRIDTGAAGTNCVAVTNG
jgi:LysR family transcriptional regulator for bpeEF and oprC